MRTDSLFLKMHDHHKFLVGLFIVCAMGIKVCNGQAGITDTLLQNLNQHPQEDTIRLNLLNKLAIEYPAKDPGSGLKFADMAIGLAKKLNQKPALAEAYMAKARNYAAKSEPKNTLEAQLLAEDVFYQLNDKPSLIKCIIGISISYYSIANYTASLRYASKSVTLALQTGDKKLIATSYASMGISYTWLADYPKAIDYYYKELKIVEDLHDKSLIAKTTGNIGVIYYYLKQYPEALKYYQQCLKILEEEDDKIWVAAALNNIGGVYLETGDYLKAVAYNTKALEINQVLNSKKGIANDLVDMGVAYSHLNNYDDGFDCLLRAIYLYDKIGAKNNSSIALGHVAMMYCDAPPGILLKQGISPIERYNKALQLQQKSVKLAHEAKSLSNEADQLKNLSLIYEKQNNYKDALKSYRSYTLLKDSIFNDKKRTEMTRLSIQYDFDKKEADLKAENAERQARARAELSRQKVIKNASIIIGLVLLLSGFTTFAFYKRRNDAHEKQKDAEFKVQVAETEMKALRSQLNPHFIFNSLNSIGDYIARHDKETADIYLVKFAKLMRMILENSEHRTISLEDDLKTLELYIQLEALRLGHKLLYEIVIDEEIDTEIAMVPPMILQPFVENSIWHGISPKEGGGKIIISVKKDGDMIAYTVEDNGIGRTGSAALKAEKNGAARKSFGIKVIQSRINIINEAQKTNAQVEMTDLDEGTRVSIQLPYELKF